MAVAVPGGDVPHAIPNEAPLLAHFGIDALRFNSVHMIDDDTALLAAGNFALLVDIRNGGVVAEIHGPSNGGIGVTGVHPSRKDFVVCDKNPVNAPLITVYDCARRQATRTMKGGAARGYSACTFSHDGELFATVSTEPDFVLTVWNWMEGSVVLRNKAFGAPVETVKFSPYDNGKLVTGGASHIKFWEMASTFTGLKLQGSIGKFGKLDLSDVTAFVILSDGKVISGSESGILIMWEGNLVKCAFMRPAASSRSNTESMFVHVTPADATEPEICPTDAQAEPRPAHDGRVDILELIEDGRLVMSAGWDGYVRYWDVQELDLAEGDAATGLVYYPRCLKEVFLGHGVLPRSITVDAPTKNTAAASKRWVYTDASGAVRSMPVLSYEDITGSSSHHHDAAPMETHLRFNGGPFLCAAASPIDHTAVTGGADGSLRLISYLEKRELYNTIFSHATLSVAFLKSWQGLSGYVLLASFACGSVRLIARGPTEFAVLETWRPHRGRVIAAVVDETEERLCTIGEDGNAFFFRIVWQGGNIGDTDGSAARVSPVRLEPFGYCALPLKGATCAEWDWGPRGACLVGFENGTVLAIQPPSSDSVDPQVSYEFECVYAAIGLRCHHPKDQKSRWEAMKARKREARAAKRKGAAVDVDTDANLLPTLDDMDEDNEEEMVADKNTKQLRVQCISRAFATNDLAALLPDTTSTIGGKNKNKSDAASPSRSASPMSSTSPTSTDEDENVSEKRSVSRDAASYDSTKSKKRSARQGTFVIGFDGHGLSQLYACATRYPGLLEPPPIPLTGIEPQGRIEDPIAPMCDADGCGAPLASARSADGSELHVIYEGAVLVRSRIAEWQTDSCVVSSMHDGVDSRITASDTSFDGTVLITAGSDGLLVAYRSDICVYEPKAKNVEAPPVVIIDKFPPELADCVEQKEVQEITTFSRMRSVGVPQPVEEKEPVFLTIQEQKEADDAAKREESALSRREALQRKVDAALNRYAQAVAMNEKLPPEERLTSEQMNIGLNKGLEEEKERRLAAAREPFSWELAKSETLTHKLRAHYVDYLLYDRFMVNSADGTFAVSSLRTRPLSEANRDCLAEASPVYSSETVSRHASTRTVRSLAPVVLEGVDIDGDKSSSRDPRRGTLPQKNSDGSFQVSSSARSHLDKTEARRYERESRQEGYNELLALKPTGAEQDEECAKELSELDVKSRGFVLQSDPTYRTPHDRRPTVQSKLRQMAHLQDEIVNVRSMFNEKLLKTLEEKKKLTETVNGIRRRIGEIMVELGETNCKPALIQLTEEEQPESRFDVTRQQLDVFAVEQARKRDAEEAARKAQGGFGGDLAADVTVEEAEKDTDAEAASSRLDLPSGDARGRSQSSSTLRVPNQRRRLSSLREFAPTAQKGSMSGPSDSFGKDGNRLSFTVSNEHSRKVSRLGTQYSATFGNSAASGPLPAGAAAGGGGGAGKRRSDVDQWKSRVDHANLPESEKEELAMKMEYLAFEEQMLTAKDKALCSDFDKALFNLSVERAQLDSAVCAAERQLLLLYREYTTLMQFEKRDVEQTERLAAVNATVLSLEQRAESCQKRIEKLKGSMEKLGAQEKILTQDGEDFVRASFPAEHHAYLIKVFRRYVRRKTSADALEDDDDITSDEDEEAAVGEVDDGGPFEEELPPDCDEEMWDELLLRRGKRLKVTNRIMDRKSLATQRQRELDDLEKQRTQAEADAAKLTEEMEVFHMIKQRAIQQLESIVVLHPRQIYCYDETGKKLPRDLQSDDIVLFTEGGFEELRTSIANLAKEKRDRRSATAALASRSQHLRTERAKKQAEHAEWEKRVVDMMLLKFGRRVDLEKLENVGTNRELEELRAHVRAQEMRMEAELRRKDAEIEKLRQDAMESLAGITMNLQGISDAKYTQRNMERALNKSDESVLQRLYGVNRVATEADRANLKDLIAAQQDEISAISSEITMLRRKGGHAYMPSYTQ